MDPILLYDKIKALQKDKNLSNRRLCELAGVSHSALDNWRRRNIIPSIFILEGFCEVLGITLAGLFNDIDSSGLNDRQLKLLEEFEKLSDFEQSLILEIIKAFLN